MNSIHIRNFMLYTPEECRDALQGIYRVQFDDEKVLELTSKEVILTRYFLVLFEMFPEYPISSEYAITNFYNEGGYHTGSHNQFFNKFLREIQLNYLIPKGIRTQDLVNKIYKNMFELINRIYNTLVYEILEYVSSINIEDLLDIQLDPELLTSIDAIDKEPGMQKINDAYEVLHNVMLKNKHNTLAKVYLSGIASKLQVKQVVGPRGYCTELDGTIFKYPISNSFTLGMNNIYDVATESRSAAKALYLSTSGIRQSEYFARELQLLSMYLKEVVFEDCGNDKYVSWYVRGEERDPEGNVIHKGDLPNLVGKTYWDDELETERFIEADMVDLIGKTIQIRSVYHCRFKDKHAVCYKCFGALAYNVPKSTSIGHFAATTMSADLTQKILSTKHLVGSAVGNSLELDDIGKKFFVIRNDNQLSIVPSLRNKSKNIKILIPTDQAFGLKDIRNIEDVKKIDPSRTTRLDTIYIKVDDGEEFPVTIKTRSSYGIIEPRFLEYIVDNNYQYDNERDMYVIDLSGWVSPIPIITVPEKEYSFSNFGSDVKKLIQTRTPTAGNISKDTPESLTFKLFNFLNSKLDINLAIIESIVYVLIAQDYPNENYDLGRNSKNPQLVDLRTLLAERSMSAAYAHEDQLKKLFNPASFFNENRPDHPLDVMFKPNDVIKENFRWVFS